jgi:hypothetical protein
VIGPCLIAERRRTDQQRRPGTRPWTQCPAIRSIISGAPIANPSRNPARP